MNVLFQSSREYAKDVDRLKMELYVAKYVIVLI